MAGLVKRYACWPTLTTQTVGEHCWQVLRIYMEIFGAPSPEVTFTIVHHDTAELVVGDPPFPTKMNNPVLKQLYDKMEVTANQDILGQQMPYIRDEERTKIKICDLLDMWEFGLHEKKLGNQYAQPIIDDTQKVIYGMAGRYAYMSVVEYMAKRESNSEQQ